MGGGSYFELAPPARVYHELQHDSAFVVLLTPEASRVLTLTEMWAVINRPVSKFPIKIEPHVFGFNGIVR